ncbi:hypothetical protein Q4Q35_02580 [Flavivirga aquimarina]|uniref:Uncharacterized protein n=1 Tax=Flavivirga aquimarina TaxID=2027862 RepID=A0ABT8W6D8_9FLAO|nr:hypothetical protein [Flavivirga aquimarina]MDO5968683.1 hypothetical protein [Flavivirga aquimarina]
MCSIDKLNDKTTQTTFDKKVVSATQHLKPYVKHRLYVAESTGVIPINMYTSNDLIDECIAKFYESGYDIDLDTMSIKIKLFKIVDYDLDELFKKEDFHKNTVSTNSILEEELDSLEEKYTIDEGFDFIMNEELDDISYHQNTKHKHLFLYDDNSTSVLSAFEVGDTSSINTKKVLGKFYSWLPLNITNVVDLFVFGKLQFEEISKIKNIEIGRIVNIMDAVEKSLRKHLS